MQQKPATKSPYCATVVSVSYDSMASSLDEYSDSSTLSEPSSIAPLRSALKRSGRRSRGFRVSINESLNETVESDYVILLQENEEPQLVSVKALDLTNLSSVPTSIDVVTLSPPEGYKDCFGRAINEELNDDSDNDCDDARKDWFMNAHDPQCPHANLPDILSPNKITSLSGLDNRYGPIRMKSLENQKIDVSDYKYGMKGILKGGKLWKSGDKNYVKYESDEKRSVRFSERDEYKLDDSSLRLNDHHSTSHNEIIIHSGMPQMNPMIIRNSHDWHLDLDGMNSDKIEENSLHFADLGQFPVAHTCPKHGKFINEKSIEDDHIRESIQRYEEMRRRIALSEIRDNNSVDHSKEYIDSHISDLSNAETRIRRIENSEAAHVAGTVMRSNNEVRRAIERNALRRSLIRFSDARKKDSNKNDKGEKHESSLIEKLKWLTTEDATNGNANKRKNENSDERGTEGKNKELSREDSLMLHTIEQYRKLAEMFNKSTASRMDEYQAEEKEWTKYAEVLVPETEGIAEFAEDLPLAYVPAAETDQINEEEVDKLIYSGGVRYTKEGTLPHVRKSAIKGTHEHPKTIVNGCCLEEKDEALPEEKSSSITSSQSSPRYATKNDSEVITESGYSSNDLSSENSARDMKDSHVNSDNIKKNADNYIEKKDDIEDHGFSRRPSVRGVKTRQNSFNKDFQTHRGATCTQPTKLSISKCNHLDHIPHNTTEDIIVYKNACNQLNTKSEHDHSKEKQRQSYVPIEYDGLPSQNFAKHLTFNGSGQTLENQVTSLERESLMREASHQRLHLNPQMYQTVHFNSTSQVIESPSDNRFISGLGEASNSQTEYHIQSDQDHGQFISHSVSYDPSYPSQQQCEYQHEMGILYQDSSRNMQVSYDDIDDHHYHSHNCNHEVKQTSNQHSQDSLSPCGNHVFSQANTKLSPVQHISPIPTLSNDSRKLTSCVHSKQELIVGQYSDKALSSSWNQGQMKSHNFNQNNVSNLPIMSSHNSYTTPIVPDSTMDKAPCLLRGMMNSEDMKYSLELNNCLYKASDPLLGDLTLKSLAMNNVN